MGEILVRRQLRGEEAGSKPEPLRLPLSSQDPLPELSGQIAPVARLTAEPDRRGSDTDGLRVETPQGTLLIQGDSILCPCPECNSPLSIRLWLLIVDCWNCGSAVELSEEQLAAIDQALQQKALSAQGVRPRGQTPGSDPLSLPIESPADPDLAGSSPSLPPGRQPPQTTTLTQRPPKTTTKATPARDLEPAPRPFRLGPAWILSLLFHLLLLLLLTLITFQQTDLWESITISTYLDEADTEGGDIEQLELSPELTDLPPPPLENLSPEEVRDVLIQADQDARQLQIDPEPNVPLPAISEVRGRLDAPPGTVSSFAARDPRLRSEIVKQEGGTLLTEAAVSRGLRWLAEHQNRDGSWSLRDFERASDPNNQGDPAGTSLALLPFLGAGQTHEYGVYKDQVGRGLRWLIQQQKPDGDLRGNLDDARGMYAHGQGTIVLVEALAMTGDERFRIPAQKAIDFIVAAQHDEGGWRYRPREAGDTSVLGWQLMALQSARTPGTGLRVPDETLRLASYYLDLCASENGSRYSYQPGQRGQPTPSMTAEALLCRMYLGWTGDDPRLRAGLNWLEREHAPNSTRRNIYYWYYATQIFHHAGGPAWDRWNVEMRDLLVNAQVKRGEHAGSWHPDEYEFGQQGGRIFTTSLGVCILEVYYRHLPLFKRLDLGEGEEEASPAE